MEIYLKLLGIAVVLGMVLGVVGAIVEGIVEAIGEGIGKGIGKAQEKKKKRKEETNKYRVCPVCGEQILKVAKKCKHCREFLESAGEENQKSEPQKKKRSMF